MRRNHGKLVVGVRKTSGTRKTERKGVEVVPLN
jgi:hypothetical protein